MLTSTSVLLWILLFWLIASDNELPWNASPPSPGKAKAKAKDVSRPKEQTKSRVAALGSYARFAAYVAMAGLFWSWSSSQPPPTTTTVGSQPAQSAEPSFRVESVSLHPSEDQAHEPTKRPIEPPQREKSDDIFHDAIRNETLGFQKIFVVNLPERTDKRDALSLVSTLTDIKLTWTAALRGTSVPDKALPLGVDRAGWRDGGIGSWRSQMNIIRT